LLPKDSIFDFPLSVTAAKQVQITPRKLKKNSKSFSGMFIETKINRLTKKQESKISLYCPFRAKIKEKNIQSGVNTDKSLEGKKK
jgi:hypothetical protein